MAKIRAIAIVVGVLLGFAGYQYAPPLSGGMQAAALAECNRETGGDFRNFDLTWVAGLDPHWRCFDLADPARGPIDLGWWVNPVR